MSHRCDDWAIRREGLLDRCTVAPRIRFSFARASRFAMAGNAVMMQVWSALSAEKDGGRQGARKKVLMINLADENLKRPMLVPGLRVGLRGWVSRINNLGIQSHAPILHTVCILPHSGSLDAAKPWKTKFMRELPTGNTVVWVSSIALLLAICPERAHFSHLISQSRYQGYLPRLRREQSPSLPVGQGRRFGARRWRALARCYHFPHPRLLGSDRDSIYCCIIIA